MVGPEIGRRPIIGVIGSGTEEHRDRAEPIGRWIAEAGADLVTGGGAGVMSATCRGFASAPGRAGRAIAIIPCEPGDPTRPRPDYPNPWADLIVRTHLPDSGSLGEAVTSRNHLIVLTADVLIALPGAAGTASETRLAVRYGRPIVAHLQARHEIPGLPDAVPVESCLGHVFEFVRSRLDGLILPPPHAR